MKRSFVVLTNAMGQGIGLRGLLWITVLLAVTVASIATGPVLAPADLVIRHARVYTVDDQHPWAESVAVLGDRIAWVGADSEAAAYIGASTHVVEEVR